MPCDRVCVEVSEYTGVVECEKGSEVAGDDVIVFIVRLCAWWYVDVCEVDGWFGL